MQGEFLSTTCSLDGHWISLSLPPPPAVWTCRRYSFLQPAVWTCVMYPFPPPVVLMYRVYQFPQPAEWQDVSLSTASSMDMQGVLPFSTCSMDVQGVSISTASSMYVQCAVCRLYAFPPPAVRTCRVYYPLLASSMNVHYEWYVPVPLTSACSTCQREKV